MKVTKCKKCREKGHWSRECPENKQSSVNGFVFMNETSAEGSRLVLATLSDVVRRCEEALRSNPGAEPFQGDVFMTAEGGNIIVDTAAAQGLIGPKSLAQLEKKLSELGYQVERVTSRNAFARGVGGRIPVLPGTLIPLGLEGHGGVMQVDLVGQEPPALMPVGMQEMLGAVIDLPQGRVQFAHLGRDASREASQRSP
eukprot:2417924-Pyramimonas_sp.AAC.1